MSESELLRKLVEQFLATAASINDTLVRLESAINHLSDGQKEVAREISELRRDIAGLIAKFEVVISRR